MFLLPSTEKLMRELRDQLKTEIYCLECSDDRLFTNGNGNLPRYEELTRQLRQAEARLADMAMTPQQRMQKNIDAINKARREKVSSARRIAMGKIGRVRWLSGMEWAKVNPCDPKILKARSEMSDALEFYRQVKGA